MEIVAINEDDRADGQGKAGLTWISKTLLNTAKPFDSTAGRWSSSEIRTYLNEDILNMFPIVLQNDIVNVTKSSMYYKYNTDTTSDKIWLPSYREFGGSSNYTTETGPVYSSKPSTKGGKNYWLRTNSSTGASSVYLVFASGSVTSQFVTQTARIALGFCTN